MPIQHSGDGETQPYFPVHTLHTLKNISLRNERWEERSWHWRRERSTERRRESEEESLLFGAEINVWDKAVLGFYQMMQRIIASQREGFPHCCVSRLRLQGLFVVFQTISSCSPLTLLHLVCNAALAICTCLDSNYGVVKAFSPVACKFLLSHTLKSTESHLNGVHVALLFATVVVVINLFSMPYALHINK